MRQGPPRVQVSVLLAFTMLRPVQFSEQSGMEEESRELVLAEIVVDLANHYDTVWIAASRDAQHPLVIVGVNEDPSRIRDRDPIDRFAQSWIGLWHKKFGDDLVIEIVPYNDLEWLEWNVLADKRLDVSKPLEWMESCFFSEDPFGDNAGLEEQSSQLEVAA